MKYSGSNIWGKSMFLLCTLSLSTSMTRFTVEPEDSYTSRVGSNLSLPCSVADRRGLVQWTRWWSVALMLVMAEIMI